MQGSGHGGEVGPRECHARYNRSKRVAHEGDLGGPLEEAFGTHVLEQLVGEVAAHLLEGGMRGVDLVRRGAEEAQHAHWRSMAELLELTEE